MQTQLTEKLIAVINDMAASMGFADWGVASLCDAVDEEAQQRYLRRMHEQGFAQMGYLERNLPLRFNPQELVPGAKSILVFLIPFGRNERINCPAPISISLPELPQITSTIAVPTNTEDAKACNASTIAVPTGTEDAKACDEGACTKSGIATQAVLSEMFPTETTSTKVLPQLCASQFALGQDYHKVIKKKLRDIMLQIKKLELNFEGRAFVDSAPVMERYWAVRAGLGFIGKNNFLISPKAGIRNFLGCIICNLDFPVTNTQPSDDSLNCQSKHSPKASIPEMALVQEDTKVLNLVQSGYQKKTAVGNIRISESAMSQACGSCRKCIDACPSGALSAAFTLKADKCISYRTIEAPEAAVTRKNIIEQLQTAIGTQATKSENKHCANATCYTSESSSAVARITESALTADNIIESVREAEKITEPVREAERITELVCKAERITESASKAERIKESACTEEATEQGARLFFSPTQKHISIFGCDRCMDACPWNRFNLTGWSEFEPQALPIPISHFHRR